MNNIFSDINHNKNRNIFKKSPTLTFYKLQKPNGPHGLDHVN